MNKTVKKYKEKGIEILSFWIALIPRLWIVMQTIPLRTIGDEMGHIAGAAFFSGYNWANSIVDTQYYGQGFYSLFFWVFWITDNPIIIYRIILGLCCLLQALVVFVIFYICKNYAKIDNVWAAMFITISSSYMIVTRVDIIYNEHILNVLTWLIFFILCKIIYAKDNKEFVLWSIWLCLLMGWGITIHLRFAVCLIALFIVLFLYYIIIKKEYKKLFIIMLSSLTCFAGYVFTKYMQNLIWRPNGSTENLGNTTVKLRLNAIFSNITSVKARIDIILGQMNTITIFSCSFFSLAVIILGIYLWKGRKEKESKFYTMIFICGGLFLLSIGGTCFAQALSWGSGVYKGLINGITDGSYYSYKGITYIRYFGPYISPLIALGNIVLWKRKSELQICLKANVCIVIFLAVYWLNNIQYYINNNTVANEVYIFFSQKERGEKLAESLYLYGLLWGIASAIILLIFLKKHTIFVYGIFSLVLIWNYMYTAYNIDLPTQESSYMKIDKSYEVLMDMYESTEEVYYYYYKPTNLGHKTYATNYLLLQFWMPRKQIIPLEEGVEVAENAVIISNGLDFGNMLKEEKYLYASLDKFEYLFVLGDYIESYESYLKSQNIKYDIYN